MSCASGLRGGPAGDGRPERLAVLTLLAALILPRLATLVALAAGLVLLAGGAVAIALLTLPAALLLIALTLTALILIALTLVALILSALVLVALIVTHVDSFSPASRPRGDNEATLLRSA